MVIIKHNKWRDIAFKVSKIEKNVYHGQYINISINRLGIQGEHMIGVKDTIKITPKDFKESWSNLHLGGKDVKETVHSGRDETYDHLCQQQDLEGF